MTTKGRKQVGAKARFEVFKRDGFTCQYCGSHPPNAILHVDHIIAVAEGGENDQDNLVTSCDRCNFGKGARPLSSVPKSLAEKAAEVKEREAQLRGYSEVMMDRRDRLEDDAWSVLAEFMEHFSLDGVSKDWFRSVKSFVDKIGLPECMEAMDAALSRCRSKNDVFRYFCGVCWRKVRAQT